MKLKNMLVMAFLILTFIPITISLFLLYISGFSLSKASYTRNLVESIGVQEDYITQTLENNMISDKRFADKVFSLISDSAPSEYMQNDDLFNTFHSYLESSEDKVTVALLLDQENKPIYTIGEKTMLNTVTEQLPVFSELEKQTLIEFKFSDDDYSLGIITPIWNTSGSYDGSFISVYDQSYIFKIISSYYEIADTSTYLCRENGEILNSRGSATDKRDPDAIAQVLIDMPFASEGDINTHIGSFPISGYYKNIYTSPWYLVGIVDDSLIYAFTNQFALTYVLIIIIVLIADIFLAFYFSNKVVEPINQLINVMDDYQNNLTSSQMPTSTKRDYYETRYLRKKFFDLMKTILLVQHNYKGVYQLYHSNDMGDINIELDVENQIAHSNKETFQDLMNGLVLPPEACVVERFTNCFCEKDQKMLMDMFIGMRDKHLSITREAEIYTPYLNEKWFHSLVVPMYNGNRLENLFIQLRDITNFKKQELESSEQAKRDALTGLYNRAGFICCVNDILQCASKRESDLHGLLFIDMDYFKLVNDNFGHGEGDELLRSIAKTLADSVGSNDIVSRFGGDEFAVFLPHTTAEYIEKQKNILNQRLLYPYHTAHISFAVSASIGISTWSHLNPDTLDELLKQADASMYQAKREFKQSVGENENEVV